MVESLVCVLVTEREGCVFMGVLFLLIVLFILFIYVYFSQETRHVLLESLNYSIVMLQDKQCCVL